MKFRDYIIAIVSSSLIASTALANTDFSSVNVSSNTNHQLNTYQLKVGMDLTGDEKDVAAGDFCVITCTLIGAGAALFGVYTWWYNDQQAKRRHCANFYATHKRHDYSNGC